LSSPVAESGQSNTFINKLDSAMKTLIAGNTETVANELNAFINQIETYINTRKLSATEGQVLIDGANSVVNALSDQNK